MGQEAGKAFIVAPPVLFPFVVGKFIQDGINGPVSFLVVLCKTDKKFFHSYSP
jgi:hypothetical protein